MSRHRLVTSLTDFLLSQGLVGSTGVVALSGGPDSLALARAAHVLHGEGVLRGLHLAHLNHQLRGSESDADEQFVRDVAGRWQLPLRTTRHDVAAQARREGHNLEDLARRLRYDWLAQVAREQGAVWVATGHTADDQAETVLHRLLRGAGLTGLAGIAPRRLLSGGIELIRPFLAVPRRDVLDFLAAESLSFREDASNADVRFTRNRLRHELLPLLRRDFNPEIDDVLNRVAHQASEAQQAITELARAHLAAAEKPRADAILVFDRAVLGALSPFWAREVFRLAWSREGWPTGAMTHADWQRLVALVRGGLTRHDFPDGVHGRSLRSVVQLWRN